MPHRLTSFWNDLAAKPAEHFPNHLADPPGAVYLPRGWGLLAALVLCCLAMRLWMAARWQIIWPDAVRLLPRQPSPGAGQRPPAGQSVRSEHISADSGAAQSRRAWLTRK